jgi:hypothetical protein
MPLVEVSRILSDRPPKDPNTFEIETARTLATHEATLGFHTEEIKILNAGIQRITDRFDHFESDIHEMKDAIHNLQNPTIDEKKLRRQLWKFTAGIAVLVIASLIITIISRLWFP